MLLRSRGRFRLRQFSPQTGRGKRRLICVTIGPAGNLRLKVCRRKSLQSLNDPDIYLFLQYIKGFFVKCCAFWNDIFEYFSRVACFSDEICTHIHRFYHLIQHAEIKYFRLISSFSCANKLTWAWWKVTCLYSDRRHCTSVTMTIPRVASAISRMTSRRGRALITRHLSDQPSSSKQAESVSWLQKKLSENPRAGGVAMIITTVAICYPLEIYLTK